MTIEKPKKGEYLVEDLSSKEVYFYIDEENKINVKSREVYKNKPVEIHFPFSKKGRQKYRFIETIEFHKISPSMVSGVFKAVTFGLGFTKNLSPIIYELERIPSIGKIIISSELNTEIKRSKIIFNTNDLENIFSIIKPFKEKQGKELKRIANNTLSDFFPEKIKKKIQNKYNKGDLTCFVVNNDIHSEELSDKDIAKVVDLIPEKIQQEHVVYQIEGKIELIKLENVREKFRILLSQKTKTNHLEKRFQKFFKNNSWIFSHIFSLPVVLYEDEVYVGGKNVHNKDGKLADFIFKNKLSKNAFIIEIKTHKTGLLKKKAYRGTNVFELEGDFTGAINQVLNQKDNLIKSYSQLLLEEYSNGSIKEFYEVFNPKAILIIGSIKDLTKKQKNNFELFRNNLKDVEIITFDEVYEKIDFFINLLRKPDNLKNN